MDVRNLPSIMVMGKQRRNMANTLFKNIPLKNMIKKDFYKNVRAR